MFFQRLQYDINTTISSVLKVSFKMLFYTKLRLKSHCLSYVYYKITEKTMCIYQQFSPKKNLKA